MLTGLAHTALCVPDVEKAVEWYTSVLGLQVLSPPYLMEGEALAADMGELVPDPAIKAAILGLDGSDRVLEVIEYPRLSHHGGAGRDLTDWGFSHVGLVCDDIDRTRTELERKGVRFLTTGIALVAGLRTTWFADPFGSVFILMEKGRPDLAYYRQWHPAGKGSLPVDE